jgi:histidinol-phosphatase
VDIAAEPELSLWDLAALAPIVTGAGGTFTAADGSPVGADTRSALATNGLLHGPVIGGLGLG